MARGELSDISELNEGEEATVLAEIASVNLRHAAGRKILEVIVTDGSAKMSLTFFNQAGATRSIDWTAAHQWSFAPINEQRFPAVALARHCGEIGGGATTIYNAANEIAVAAFINQAIPFTAIVKIVESSVNALAQGARSIRDLSDVSAIEQDARLHAERFVAEMRS